MKYAAESASKADKKTSVASIQPHMHAPRLIPAWSNLLPLQASLKINAPGDKYEQEADRIAEQIVRMPDPQLQRATCSCGKPMGPDGECAECKKKNLGIQRMASRDASQTSAPPIVHQVLQQPGRPLDGATRNFMESRFGQDFGHVRVHTDGKAADAAQTVNARAFTVGQNLVFGRGEYTPTSFEGQRLLAHEMTHILQQQQQAYARPTVQRDSPPAGDATPSPEPIVERRDIVFVMDFKEAASLVSPTAQRIEVNTPQEMADHLKTVTFPIGTIYVFAHSSPTADIVFPTTGLVTASSLANTLKGTIEPENAPNIIDFRGCSVGMNPAGMEEIRQASGAKSVIGSSCFLVFMTLPFTVDNVHIKERQQLNNPRNRETWNKHFPTHWKGFASNKCVLDKSADAYFTAGGYLVSIFADKQFTKTYSPTDSVCFADLPVKELSGQDTATHIPSAADSCTLIRVSVDPPTPTEASTTPSNESDS